MMGKVVFRRKDTVIAEFPFLVEDMSQGVKAAFDEFRRSFPQLSLFDDDISFRLEKLETDDADRT